MPRTPSLLEFAAAQPNPFAKCRLCALPAKVNVQMREAHDAGVPGTVIAKWLDAAHTLKVSADAVRRHLASHP